MEEFYQRSCEASHKGEQRQLENGEPRVPCLGVGGILYSYGAWRFTTSNLFFHMPVFAFGTRCFFCFGIGFTATMEWDCSGFRRSLRNSGLDTEVLWDRWTPRLTD